MNCRKIKDLLPIFLENGLSQDNNSQVKKHLERCPGCNKELMLIKKSWDLLENYEEITASPGFSAKFWQKVSKGSLVTEKKPFLKSPVFIPRWAPAFVMVLLILLGSGGVYLKNIFVARNIQNFALVSEYENVSMLQDIVLAEELDLVENIDMLEEAEIIASIEL